MLEAHPDFTPSVMIGLGWFYLLLFAMNAGWTMHSYKSGRSFDLLGAKHLPTAGLWALYSALLLMISLAHFFSTSPSSIENFLIRLPEGFKVTFDSWFADPVFYFTLSVVGFVAMILLRACGPKHTSPGSC